MKRICLFLTILMMLTVFVSCSEKKAPKLQQKKEYTFNHQDSVDVLHLVDQFKAYLEQNDLRSAVEMLSILKDSTIVPMDPVQQRRQAMALSMVKGVKYDVDYLMFNSDRNNEIKMNITLFEKETNDPRPNMTSFYFRPVRFEGKWYLTVKDNITDRENGNNFLNEGVESEYSDTEYTEEE